MASLFKKRLKEVGLPPGTIVDTAATGKKAYITLFDYDVKNFQEKRIENVEECFLFKESATVTWINVEGVDAKMIQQIGEHFGVHPLVCEDIVSLGQRPKVEEYDDHIFIVLKMIYFSLAVDEIIDEQISLIVGSNFVISFQEREGDVFDPIRARIREAKGRIRTMGSDYLAYCLLDAVVDNYYYILERRGEEVELLEEDIMTNPGQRIAHEIHQLKRDMINLRKQIWPLREVVNGLQRNESKLIQKTTRVYLRDVYDNIIQVIDAVESFRDILSGLHDIYLSSISNRMNEIMKVLTVFASIFIPLTFIAGVYGMNFEYMPGLHWRWGYYVLLGFMASAVIGMLVFFKNKKWI